MFVIFSSILLIITVDNSVLRPEIMMIGLMLLIFQIESKKELFLFTKKTKNRNNYQNEWYSKAASSILYNHKRKIFRNTVLPLQFAKSGNIILLKKVWKIENAMVLLLDLYGHYVF